MLTMYSYISLTIWCVYIVVNATKVLQSYVGAGKSKVMATVYKFMMNGSIIYATMGDVGCVPLAYEAAGTTKDGGTV